jgi:hypothetical protein
MKMRKLIILAVLVILGTASTGMAAMTCVDGKADGTVKNGIRSSNGQVVRLYATCTHNTTPGTAVAALPANMQAAINNGLYVYRFSILPGATGPTDNSDLQILDADGLTIIAAAGNGANVIDNTAKTSVIYGDGPTPGSTNLYPLGDGTAWTITVTNNAVNNSSWTLVMQATREGGDNR